MLSRYKVQYYNFFLVLLLILLCGFGVQLVGIASPSLKTRQLGGALLGFVVMLVVSVFDYSWILNFQWPIYGFNIVMLLAVYAFGDSANGAARWMDLGFIRFQPTELSKILIILFFGKFFMDHEDDLNSFRTLAKSVILLGIPLFLIYQQPDLKNTITILILFCILYYMAGLSYRVIFSIVALMVPLLLIFLAIVVQPDQKLIRDYQRDRIMSFLYPEDDAYSDDIEQQSNSRTAIASGELLGRRLGKRTDAYSVNEGNFVAENQTDFIFAVAGEEYGFVGCAVIVIMQLLIAVECIRTSLRAKDLAGKVICCGVGSVVSIQSFMNICVATGIAPNTGTPLPFISYGLTSMVSLFFGIGFVLNVGLQSRTYNKQLLLTDYEQKEEYL
ncbi:MAG: rod shape-determining protein RodA [Blautia sp.]|nr:rod shape-determining protein RodA [Blautia sp.]